MLPALALSLDVMTTTITTISNQLSRAVEARADSFALHARPASPSRSSPSRSASRCATSPTPTRRTGRRSCSRRTRRRSSGSGSASRTSAARRRAVTSRDPRARLASALASSSAARRDHRGGWSAGSSIPRVGLVHRERVGSGPSAFADRASTLHGRATRGRAARRVLQATPSASRAVERLRRRGGAAPPPNSGRFLMPSRVGPLRPGVLQRVRQLAHELRRRG